MSVSQKTEREIGMKQKREEKRGVSIQEAGI